MGQSVPAAISLYYPYFALADPVTEMDLLSATKSLHSLAVGLLQALYSRGSLWQISFSWEGCLLLTLNFSFLGYIFSVFVTLK